MITKVNREWFLGKLESVSPGLDPKSALLLQSDCFVFRNNRVFTFNDDAAGRAILKIDPPVEGAVNATKLLEVLRKYTSEDIALKVEDDRFTVMVPGKRKARILMEAEISLPIEEIEKPSDWSFVSDEFVDAVNACQIRSKGDSFVYNCLHIHPNWIESCGETQVCRWTFKTGLKQPALVKQDAAKKISALGITALSETETWLHFKNHDGAILSLKKHLGFDFKDVGTVLAGAGKGEKVSLPKGIKEAVEMAQIMASDNQEDGMVRVDLRPGEVVITGEGMKGEAIEPRKISYKGKDLSFYITSKILIMIVDKFPDCVVSNGKLKAEVGNFEFCTCLLLPEERNQEQGDE